MPDFDESFDPTSEPQGPPAPQPPDPMEPWDQSSDIRLSKLNSALQTVNQQQESSYLSPYDADRVRSQIVPERTRLLQRKQAADQMQKQQAIRDAHEQAAVQQSIQLQNRQIDADTLPNAIKPIQTPDGRTLLIGPKGAEVYDDGDTGEPGSEGVNAQPPDVKPNPDGTHTMTIQNGLHRTEVNFAQDPTSPTGWRTQGVQNYDEQGRPITPGAPVAPPSTPHDELMKEATRLAGPQPPQVIGRNRYGQPILNPAWSHWDTQRREIHGQLWKEQRTQQMQEHQRQRDEQTKAAKEKTNDFGKWVTDYEDQMQKSADKLDHPGTAENPKEPVPVDQRPAHLQSDDAMHAEAVRKAVRKFVTVHGHPPEGYEANGSPKGASQVDGKVTDQPIGQVQQEKGQPPSPTLPQVPADAEEKKRLVAEKQRRLEERQQAEMRRVMPAQADQYLVP